MSPRSAPPNPFALKSAAERSIELSYASRVRKEERFARPCVLSEPPLGGKYVETIFRPIGFPAERF
ncbi:MAG: hypothetical protein ACTS4Z_01300 [Candidatus Hodgkinia cicadicola]